MEKENIKEKGSKAPDVLLRRTFLKYLGITAAGSALVATGCRREDDPVPPAEDEPEAIDLGSGDVGVLNYALVLEQLEAAYYEQVVNHENFSTNFSEEEQTILRDFRDHEVIHREFLKAALGDNAIPALEFDFSAVNFNQRESVLETARTFEDLGVAAYNGAGKLLSDVNNLLLAGKIVSVEGRHAAAVRDLINPGSDDFAGSDVISEEFALDRAFTPEQVLNAADPFIVNEINAKNLPTS